MAAERLVFCFFKGFFIDKKTSHSNVKRKSDGII